MVRVAYIIADYSRFGGKPVIMNFCFESSIGTVSSG